MTFVRAASLAVVALLLQDPRRQLPAVDVQVFEVVSAGHWSQGAQQGRYRAIVYEESGERATHRLVVEWVAEDQRTHATRIAARFEPSMIAAGTWSLTRPAFEAQGLRWHLRLEGTSRLDGSTRGWDLALEGPGRFTAATWTR